METPVSSPCQVIATHVPDSERLAFLPRYFRAWMLIVENAIYCHLRELSPDYHGGLWDYFALSNGGCYLAPQGATFRLEQPNNGFQGTVSADAAGIISTLYALSHLSFEHESKTIFAQRFHELREFALEHAEASLIFRAID